MEIVERLVDNFNRGYFGKSMVISELSPDYPAWTIKQENWIGVAVPMREFFPFSEQFSHVRIRSAEDVYIENVKYDLLMLISDDMESRNEFAYVCADFVAPGDDGGLRESLIDNPASWWKKWKNLIGNVSSDQSIYDTLGELAVLERLVKNGSNPVWSGADYSSHDVEAEDFSIEVKTTNRRYGYEVTINSLYQLLHTDKQLFLSFVRVERSSLGRSIDSIVDNLANLGYDTMQLEQKLESRKLEKGRPARGEKFKIIEWKQYLVDESFPAITEASFKTGSLPENIVRFTYTVDLSGVAGENIL